MQSLRSQIDSQLDKVTIMHRALAPALIREAKDGITATGSCIRAT